MKIKNASTTTLIAAVLVAVLAMAVVSQAQTHTL